jgi:hypothetical protein
LFILLYERCTVIQASKSIVSSVVAVLVVAAVVIPSQYYIVGIYFTSDNDF